MSLLNANNLAEALENLAICLTAFQADQQGGSSSLVTDGNGNYWISVNYFDPNTGSPLSSLVSVPLTQLQGIVSAVGTLQTNMQSAAPLPQTQVSVNTPNQQQTPS